MTATINASTTAGIVITPDNSGALALQTNSGTTAVTIDTSQNVGIGGAVTNEGGYAKVLQITGSTDCVLELKAGSSYSYLAQNGTNLQIRNNDASGAMTFSTNATERMRIDSNGNLLIGATSSFGSGPLQVKGGNLCMTINSGTFNYSFGTASNQFNVYDGGGTLKGYLTNAGTWTNTSDIAFKKDIVDIRYNLSDLLKLRPVSYVTKDYDIPQIGFIAQEMEQVIPEVVSGEDGSKGISYGNITPLLVKAIQELKAINDQQAETINALTARIEALENK